MIMIWVSLNDTQIMITTEEVGAPTPTSTTSTTSPADLRPRS
jgi:hypothetical protein